MGMLVSPTDLFLSRAAVRALRRQIAASKPGCAAKMVIPDSDREIQFDVLTSDVMARAGGGAGPAPGV